MFAHAFFRILVVFVSRRVTVCAAIKMKLFSVATELVSSALKGGDRCGGGVMLDGGCVFGGGWGTA